MLMYRIHTLCCVTARSVLYEDVVERLVGSIGQLVDPHGSDPLLAHGAFGVPAIYHTVITRPGGGGGGGRDVLCASYFFFLPMEEHSLDHIL